MPKNNWHRVPTAQLEKLANGDPTNDTTKAAIRELKRRKKNDKTFVDKWFGTK